MYIPPSFRIEDSAKLSDFMAANSFATLITCNESVPFATHLPVRSLDDADGQTLVAHMARSNPQWKHFNDGAEVLTVFAGPHAYISPSWYTTEEAVPTWNYAAVHVYGIPTIMDNHDRIVALLADTVDFYERSFEKPWPYDLPDELRNKLIGGIVAFEIQVTRIEGKFKLGQNRSSEDLSSVYNALSASINHGDQAVADLMRSEGLVDRPEA